MHSKHIIACVPSLGLINIDIVYALTGYIINKCIIYARLGLVLAAGVLTRRLVQTYSLQSRDADTRRHSLFTAWSLLRHLDKEASPNILTPTEMAKIKVEEDVGPMVLSTTLAHDITQWLH